MDGLPRRSLYGVGTFHRDAEIPCAHSEETYSSAHHVGRPMLARHEEQETLQFLPSETRLLYSTLGCSGVAGR